MARKPRFAPGGLAYHVLNRSAGRSILFRRDGDFGAFERVLVEAYRRVPLRLLSYRVMGDHWHFVTRPGRDGQLTEFFRRLAHTLAMRWRVAHDSVAYGHLYQGRFESFPIQSDGHLGTARRYVERNPLTAGLVRRARTGGGAACGSGGKGRRSCGRCFRRGRSGRRGRRPRADGARRSGSGWSCASSGGSRWGRSGG